MNCNVFIIPNFPQPFATLDEFPQTQKAKRWDRWMREPMQEDDVLVQCWFQGEDVDNWGSHGAPEGLQDATDNTGKYDRFFINDVPLRFLKNLKEGDTFKLPLRGNVEVVFTAQQLGHRYARFGAFERCLQDLLNSCAAYL